MADLTSVSLPRLPSNWQDNPTLFARYWNQAMSTIETTFNAILQIPELQTAIQAAQTAADNANAAADAAQSSATNAQTAADNAQAATDATTAATSLANSYITPTNVLTATSGAATATISIAANNRVYGDGTSVPVNSGSIAGLAVSTLYYIYYSDPSRTGGAVTYMASTNSNDAAQVGDIHTVGSITTPAASGTSSGAVVNPPGVGSIKNTA